MIILPKFYSPRLKRNIENKSVGKLREPTERVKKTISGKYSDSNNKISAWTKGKNGESGRFFEVFIWELGSKPLNHLQKLNKRNPEIMFLGAGEGKYIPEFKERLNENNIYPKIDVFGLFKETISKDMRKEINNDYSVGVPFESLDPKNQLHKQILLKTLGKYDLIVAPLSVGIHTNYPAFALYQSALMLKKGGKAFIEVRSLNTSRMDASDKVEKQLPHLQNVFLRLVNSYNKKYSKENSYIFKPLGDIKENKMNIYLEIERTR